MFSHTEDGLRLDPKLTKAIKNCPTPQKRNHVKRFLGLSAYYTKLFGITRIK